MCVYADPLMTITALPSTAVEQIVAIRGFCWSSCYIRTTRSWFRPSGLQYTIGAQTIVSPGRGVADHITHPYITPTPSDRAMQGSIGIGRHKSQKAAKTVGEIWMLLMGNLKCGNLSNVPSNVFRAHNLQLHAPTYQFLYLVHKYACIQIHEYMHVYVCTCENMSNMPHGSCNGDCTRKTINFVNAKPESPTKRTKCSGQSSSLDRRLLVIWVGSECLSVDRKLILCLSHVHPIQLSPTSVECIFNAN